MDIVVKRLAIIIALLAAIYLTWVDLSGEPVQEEDIPKHIKDGKQGSVQAQML